MRTPLPSLFLSLTACLSFASCSSDEKPPYGGGGHLVGLDRMSACSALDEETCGTTEGCTWVGIEACGAEVCPVGACIEVDPCAAHDDADSCRADADNQCDWAEVDRLCPPGETCDKGGYCYQRLPDDGCVCVCPLSPCIEGPDGTIECPPCECDCDDGCEEEPPSCTCPECPPGETCPECSCDGSGIGGTGGDGSTGGAEGGASVPVADGCGIHDSEDACAADAACEWVGITACAPEACNQGVCVEKQSIDPCTGYGDPETCAADTANQCFWTEVCTQIDCPDGVDCPPEQCKAGCFSGLPPDDGGCVCICPLAPCVEGPDGTVECPPCECTCDDGGDGCIDPVPL
jgi:hypothetical protein